MQAKKIPFHQKSKILFENDEIFVLEKPVGVLSHPNSDRESSASIVRAPYDIKTESFLLENGEKAYLAHRLDKETSGCLLFAKQLSVVKKLREDFLHHHIKKEYIALSAGILRAGVTWKDHLTKRDGNVRFDPKRPANAETVVKVMDVFEKEKLSLLRLVPHSGKTHQLRVQTAKRNLHILGDRQYGNFKRNKDMKQILGLNRMFLHASKLELKNPVTGKKIEIESMLPLELQTVLTSLGKALNATS